MTLNPSSPVAQNPPGPVAGGPGVEIRTVTVAVLTVAALAAAYWVSAKAVLFLNPTELPIWPPIGIALGVFFRLGWRYWPGVFLGAFAVQSGYLSWWAALGMAVGSTLATAGGASLLRLLRFEPSFESLTDVAKFVLVGGLGAAGLAASNGVYWQYLNGVVPTDQFGHAWLMWWLGDATGVFVFALPVVAAPSPLRTWWRWATVAKGVALLAAAAVVSAVCVGWVPSPVVEKYPLYLFPALLTLAVTVRYRVAAGAACGLVMAVVIVWATASGGGPFARTHGVPKLILLWGTLDGLTVVVLMLAALAGGRDRVARQLAASEATYRTLVEDNPAMICRLDAAGRLAYANDTYYRAVRTTASAVVGEAFLAGALPDDRARFQAAVAGLRPGGDAAVVELLAPGGRLRWHKWTVRAVGVAGAPPDEYQAVGLDVTELRRAADERKVLEEQMFHTQKLESLGVMAGGVAHDFNNILTGILGYAELAADSLPKNAAARTHLTRVTEGARRAADMTRHLLAYAGKGKLFPRPLDPNAVVRATADLVAVSVPKKVGLRFDLAADLPWVEADETQFQQVVMNLIINAGEAIGDRPGTVTVRTDVTDLVGEDINSLATVVRQGLAPGRYVRVRVADTGCGMDAATMAKIFEPFFTTKFTGRGLGLAAVQGIARAHRGVVRVDSSPGRGSEFSILLPAVPAPAPTLPPTVAVADPPPAGGRRALVVDDEEAVRTATQRMLETLGWVVTTAADGRDGVDVFTARPDDFDVVLLDLTMPVMGGAEALDAVRLVRPDVPVVLFSGYSLDDTPNSPTAKASRLLLKPFRFADLKAAVTHAVEAAVPPEPVVFGR